MAQPLPDPEDVLEGIEEVLEDPTEAGDSMGDDDSGTAGGESDPPTTDGSAPPSGSSDPSPFETPSDEDQETPVIGIVLLVAAIAALALMRRRR